MRGGLRVARRRSQIGIREPVPGEDVLFEEVLGEDVPGEDVPFEDVLGETSDLRNVLLTGMPTGTGVRGRRASELGGVLVSRELIARALR